MKPISAGQGYVPFFHKEESSLYIEFLASQVEKVKINNRETGHLYYVLNLDSHVIKFGFSKNWKSRVKTHISNFISYSQATPERLLVCVSCQELPDVKLGEKFLIYLANDDSDFTSVSGKEFFVYLPDDVVNLRNHFHDLIRFVSGRRSKEFLKRFQKTEKPFKHLKSTNKS